MGRLRLHERWRKQAQRFLEARIPMRGVFAFCPDAARKACLDVLAAAQAREAERAVFTDWAVSRGWAPGKAPAASEAPELLTCPTCRPKCPNCSGGRGGWPGKLPELWQLRGGRRDAATPTAVKTAQRILDTLDGRCPWAPYARAGLNYLPAVELRKRPTVPSAAGYSTLEIS